MALSAAALARTFPNGTAHYVALGTDADLKAGTFAEVSDPTYARKAHSAWTTVVGPSDIRRVNSGAILFDAFTDGFKGIVCWGVFDAAVGGNLLAAGYLLNGDEEPEAMDLAAGDQARFNDGMLRVISTPPEGL